LSDEANDSAKSLADEAQESSDGKRVAAKGLFFVERPSSRARPRLLRAICEAVEKGTPPKTAAAALRVAPKAFVDWMEADKRAARSIEAAEARFIKEQVRRLNEDCQNKWGKPEPNVIMFLLSRRDPKNWSEKQTVEHNVSGQIQHLLPAEAQNSLAERRQKLISGQVIEVTALPDKSSS
jgi:hypothetical protein